MSRGSHTVELHTFGSQEPLALVLPAECTCETALGLVAKQLDMRPESMTLFGLFVGTLGAPLRVLLPSDLVPIATDICLQRWYMRRDETKILKHDVVAIHHLYCEARHKLDNGDMSPSEEQTIELDSYSDPLFPTERQYLDVARGVPGYDAIVTKQCTVTDDIEDNSVTLAAGGTVAVCMDLEGLSLSTKDRVRLLHWPWTIVRRWKRLASSQTAVIKFEVCLHKGNASVLCWISFATPQAQLIFQAAGALCTEVKRLQDLKRNGDSAAPLATGKFYDPLKEWVDNVLFAEPKFSKFK